MENSQLTYTIGSTLTHAQKEKIERTGRIIATPPKCETRTGRGTQKFPECYKSVVR